MRNEDDLRRSAVESFGCPYRYDKIENEGVDDTGDESVRGRAWHAAAWVYILRLVAKRLKADHEEAVLAFQEGLAITGIPHALIHEVQKLFFRWAENFQLDLQAFLAAEESEKGKRIFRPDLVYCQPGLLEVVDFKTYYKGLTKAQAQKELQLKWYLLEALRVWPGFPRYRFTFDFVRLGYKVSLDFTPDQILAFEPEIQAAIDAIKRAKAAKAYPALPGSHCSLCRLVCPVADNPYRRPIRITSDTQAREVLAVLLPKEQEVKGLKKLLRDWVARHGPIEVGGEVFLQTETTKITYPAFAVLTWLDDRGVDVADIEIPRGNLGHLVHPKKGQIAVLDYLAERAIVKQGWRSSHRKAGEDHPAGLDDALEGDGDDDD